MKSELAVQSCYMFFTWQTGGGSGVELGNELGYRPPHFYLIIILIRRKRLV